MHSSSELGQNLNHLLTGPDHGLLPEHCQKSLSCPYNGMSKQEAQALITVLSEQGCNLAAKPLHLLLHVIIHQLPRGNWKQSQLQPQ